MFALLLVIPSWTSMVTQVGFGKSDPSGLGSGLYVQAVVTFGPTTYP